MIAPIKPRLAEAIVILERLAQDAELVACNAEIDLAECDVTTDEAMRIHIAARDAFNALDNITIYEDNQ